jgi:hypothetical protein
LQVVENTTTLLLVVRAVFCAVLCLFLCCAALKGAGKDERIAGAGAGAAMVMGGESDGNGEMVEAYPATKRGCLCSKLILLLPTATACTLWWAPL